MTPHEVATMWFLWVCESEPRKRQLPLKRETIDDMIELTDVQGQLKGDELNELRRLLKRITFYDPIPGRGYLDAILRPPDN